MTEITDKDAAITGLKKGDIGIYDVSEELQADKEVVMTAVQPDITEREPATSHNPKTPGLAPVAKFLAN